MRYCVLVAAVCIAHTAAARRHFQTTTEFASLRDRIIREFTQCLAGRS